MISRLRTSTVFRNFIVMFIFTIIILTLVLRGHYISKGIENYGSTIDIAGFERTRTYIVMADAFTIREHYLEGDMENYEIEKTIFFGPHSEYTKIVYYLESIRDGNEELGLLPEDDAGLIYDLNFIIDEIHLYQGVISDVVNNPEDSHDIHTVYKYANYIASDLDALVEKYVEIYHEQNELQNELFLEAFLATLVFVLILTILNSRMFIFEKTAKFDGLTGLRSIRYLSEITSKLEHKEYSVIFIDLNKFKHINDTFGHSVGDDVLRTLGRRINKVFKNDYAFRYGGDEFVILLDKNNSENLVELLDRINEEIFKPIIDGTGYKHEVSGSVGAIGIGVDKESITQALQIADKLMYRAKQLSCEKPICALNNEELAKILN